MYTEELHDLYSLPSIINDLEKRREEKGREGKRREEKGREGKGREEKRREENCAVLGYYAASSGNSLLTFRNNLSVPSSRVKNSKKKPVITHVKDLTKGDEKGKACSTYGEEGKYVQGLGGEKWKKETALNI